MLLLLVLAAGVRADTPLGAQQTRQAFPKIIDRPRVDLAPQVQEQSVENRLARIHFTYSSEADQRVPGILLAKPELLNDGDKFKRIVESGAGHTVTPDAQADAVNWLARWLATSN